MTTAVTNGVDLADRISQLFREARQAGEPVPGRPTLVKRLGVTDYAVRKALAELGEPGDDSTPSESPSEVTEQLPTVVPTPPLATAGVGGGKAFSLAGVMLGAIVSMVFNVLDAWIPPDHAPSGWTPTIAAQGGAVVWPLFLIISVEIVARAAWPGGKWWQVPKVAGAVLVALVGAVISYQHIQAVLLSWNYNALSAGAGPLAVDGLMVVAGFGLLAENLSKKQKAA